VGATKIVAKITNTKVEKTSIVIIPLASPILSITKAIISEILKRTQSFPATLQELLATIIQL